MALSAPGRKILNTDAPPLLHWTEDGQPRSARWRSERAAPPPRRVVLADDRINADKAFSLATQGTGLLWRGDFHNARQLLDALGRRIDKRSGQGKPGPLTAEAFHRLRMARAQRARTLGMLLIELDAQGGIALRRAPDLRQACQEAWGENPDDLPQVASLRELLGLVGAHEWRRKGLEIPSLGARIHPHYGVFAPVRSEYLDLVAQAPLAAQAATITAFDIGTGTGVLAALLARRGVPHVVATEISPRALACAQANLEALGLTQTVTLLQADLFPPQQADLIVCNPPWLPGRPSSLLEAAVYDPDSRMLRGFLDGLRAHLKPGGEGWLLLSDLAEHLGLRSRQTLLDWIAAAGLRVQARLELRPRHPRSQDRSDPLYAARAAEITSLWRLCAA